MILTRLQYKLVTLILLVALSAVPMALYVRSVREGERRRKEAAEQAFDDHYGKFLPRGGTTGDGSSPFDSPSPVNQAKTKD